MQSLHEEREQLIEEIKEKAAAYTKDWRFYPERSDMGTVLALLYAELMEDTLLSYKNLPKAYQLHFYNLLGAGCLPANEAHGYVTFSTVNDEVPGALVPAGTKVFGEAGEKRITFETEEDIYVSPVRMKECYYVNGSTDYISTPFTFPVSGETLCNQQTHILYLGHSVLFSLLTEGELTIDFHPLSGEEEERLGELFENQAVWSYYSEHGYTVISDVRYKEGRVFLNKSMEMPAFAKTEWQGKNSYWIKMEIPRMKPESRVLLSGIKLAAKGSFLEPEVVYDGNGELYGESFFPFGEQPYPFAELYFSNDEVFCKKGAVIRLQFDLEYEKRPSGLETPKMPVKWRNIMHRSELESPESVDIRIESVIWEYYNGNGWVKIPGTKSVQDLFMQNQGRKTVEFECPLDIYPFLFAGKERYGIRLRILKMNNLYKMDSIYVVPCIKNLRLHYRYEKTDIYPEYAYAQNELVVKKLEVQKEHMPFYNLFPDKGMLYLSFSGPLNEEEICLLFVLDREGTEERCRYRYEYYGKDGFTALKVEDATFHLTRTGTVTLCSESFFEKHKFFGTDGYWLRIIWEGRRKGEHKLPPIKGIYINSTLVTAKKGSGKSGNLPVQSIHVIERNIGYINKVTNYEAVTGGWDEEQNGQALKRMADCLRHRDRAVTTKDFEDIVYHKIRSIQQVKCFAGRNGRGERAPGYITLVVLPEEISEMYFEYIRDDIYENLKPHVDRQLYEEGRICIVEPEWYPVKVYMKIVAAFGVRQHQLQEKINRSINAFVHPVTGNFDGSGWKIGTVPSAIQIQNACSQMEEIHYIQYISLQEEKPASIYSLAIGKEHEIEIVTED